METLNRNSRLTTSQNGLTQEEAQRRLAHYGYNELAEKTINPLVKFLTYFWGPIPWMIEAAAVLSALVRDWTDFVIIIVLLVTNSVVGFWEEYQAGNAIAALKARLALQARVRRDGSWRTLPARELVPGDLIRLRIGDIVPADATLSIDDPLEIDQSALTGESLPVTRKRGDVIYSGSIIRQGESDAVVSGTGQETYFGKTARLVGETQVISHFQRAVLKIGDYLIVIAIGLVMLILTVALFRHDPMLTTLKFALVLTVASIPVAMPTVLSVTLAVGARQLARKQTIVSRLAAIEELAGMDVLCSDKTGTLTQNTLTLGEPFSVTTGGADAVVLAGALASRAEDGDPIDLAVIGGVSNAEELRSYAELHFQPFDPVHKRTEATVRGPSGQMFKVTKGAPQLILGLSANSARVQAAVDQAIGAFAARGYRSLGVARTDGQNQWQFLGVLPL
ncbi:HAD-IC family P-type ATPase, partial [Petrachloros mirabilis]